MKTFKNIFLISAFCLHAFSLKSSAHAPAFDELKPGDVRGVKMLTLTDEEFLKLGVRVDSKKLTFFHEQPIELARLPIGREFTIPEEDLNVGNPVYTAKFQVTTNGMSAADIAPKNEVKKLGIAPIAPRIITSYRKQNLMAIYWESRDSASMKYIHTNAQSLHGAKSFNSLIPLHTVLKDPKSKNFKETDVILWYENTQELMALLPRRFIDRTIGLSSNDSSGENKVNSQDISFLKNYDTWRSGAGAILTSGIYPNPVGNQKATLDFSLSEDRIVTVALHDIFGRKLAELQSAQYTTAGKYSWELFFKNVARGMYLVSVQTDRGEQAIQRVLID